MPAATVSRSAEWHAMDRLLSTAQAEPAGLLLAGEPGIGKTTLWLSGVARARELGFRVLAARADEAESVLSYAAVADLLEDVAPEDSAALPDLQRMAVDRVLLRAGTDGPPTDQRVTASAVASVVTALAVEQPVLLAIDDAQWLDVSSRAVLAIVARRLSGRVGVLLTVRAHDAEPDPAAWLRLAAPTAVERLWVGPLSLGALHTVMLERFGHAFPRPTMVQIAEASGGNPFYAIELARAVASRSTSVDHVLPSTLAELVRLRTGHFEGEVGDMLLAACSVTDATVDLLARATAVPPERVRALLAAPEREGIIQVDGERVAFTHPLLARGIYSHARPAMRRRMHRALAAVEAHPELKARHMALGAVSAEPDTLSALDTAAATAAARGAAAAAADLHELAIGLGGDAPTRRLSAAEQHVRAGQTRRAREVLEPALDDFGSGSSRAAALCLLGLARMADHDYTGALPLLTEAADQAVDDLGVLAKAQLLLSRAQAMTGRQGAAGRQAELAVANAERLGAPSLISQALAQHVTLTCAQGLARDESALTRALELEVPDLDVAAPFRASVSDAITTAWMGRLDEALAGLIAARRRCIESGSDADLVYVAGHLSMVYLWLGRYTVAVDVAEDILRRGDHLAGSYPALVAKTHRATALAYLGRERAAREDAEAAIECAWQCGTRFLTGWPLMTLAFLEVSLGNHHAALKVLQPMVTRAASLSVHEIPPASYIPDAVEAMVVVGRLDEALPLVEALEGHGAQLGWPWLLAAGARCRSMVLAAGGDLAAAEEMLHRALVQHELLPMPFERARTQLFLGQVLRRQRRKKLARTTLREALGTFEELGTPLWADRARAELERTDTPRVSDSALTPSELRVAKLAAAGMTNKDIAAALFISPKTVEHNLSGVYRKVGVRTRAELASRAAELGDE